MDEHSNFLSIHNKSYAIHDLFKISREDGLHGRHLDLSNNIKIDGIMVTILEFSCDYHIVVLM